MYETPPQYPPAMPYETPTRRLRFVLPLRLLLLPLVLFAALFFGGSYAIAPEPDVEVQPGFAFAEIDGRDVVLAPYERHGARGMFQLLTQDLFQVRLAATDPATGDVLWDTQLSDELVWEASVLAAGQRYAYLATDSGLVVIDLADGSVVAEGAGVQGLGDAYAAVRTAYAYDPDHRRVMAMNATGGVVAIGLDEAVAVPVDAPTAAAWAGRLSVERGPGAPTSATGVEAVLGAGAERVALRRAPGGAPGSVLVRVTADGRDLPVGATVFHDARLVVDGVTAVAAATGHVLVEHQRSVNDPGLALSLVSLATGQVTATLAVDARVDRALVGPDGLTAIAAGEVLAAARGDGRVVPLDVGLAGFFGAPR
ncbi:PA2928 family protein [Actinosynnema sp. NPDC059335]|uniref:PA2928 family protein n=1 Tax=Actinosynnema sp. NPDC059335 TaxID=3346804 RepID=UPI003672C7C8